MCAPENVTGRLRNAFKNLPEISSLCGAPSLSIGVLDHGRVMFSDSVGHRDGNPEHLANDESIYLIGSLSKAFVAAAVGILVREGKMNWMDTVHSHLRRFNPRGDPEISKQADFIDLLSHSSGLGNPVVQVVGPGGAIVGVEDKFLDLVNATQTTDEHGNQRFGKVWEYSNINYAIVALAVEKISGRRFADFVQERILDPLGMKQTIVTKRGVECCENLADGHALLDNGTWKKVPIEWTSEVNTSVLAPYGIRSSVHDMLIWAAAWLSAGSEAEGAIPLAALQNISSNPLCEVARIFKPAWQISMEQPGNRKSFYCLGWLQAALPTSKVNWGTLNRRTMDDNTHLKYILGTKSPARTMMKHTGIAYNTTSSMFLFPESQSAVIALSNGRRRGDASDFAAQIMIQELFDLQPRVDILSRARIETTRGAAFRHNNIMVEWLKNRDVSGKEQPRRDYVGTYTYAATELHVRLDHAVNRLTLHFNHRSDRPLRLDYFNKDRYSFFPTTTDQHFSEGFFDFDNYKVGLLEFTRDHTQTVNGLNWTWEIESSSIWYKREPAHQIRPSPQFNRQRPSPKATQSKFLERPNSLFVATRIVSKDGLSYSEVLKRTPPSRESRRTRSSTATR